MNRLLFVILLNLIVGLGYSQPHFWPFGQGLSLDFSQSPPLVGNIPWQSNYPSIGTEPNVATVFEGDEDLPPVYFLNGHYYDSSSNLIHSVPNYFLGWHSHFFSSADMTLMNNSGFSVLNDTLYHVFVSGDQLGTPSPSSFTGNFKAYLNKLYLNSAGSYTVEKVDSIVGTQANQNQYIKGFKLLKIEGELILIGMELDINLLPFDFDLSHAQIWAYEVSSNSFKGLNFTVNKKVLRSIIGCSEYSPLLKRLYGFSFIQDSFQGDSTLFAYSLTKGNNSFSIVENESFTIKRFDPSGVDSNIRESIIHIDPSGEYLFVAGAVDGNNPTRFYLLRYSLLSKDNQEFKASYRKLPVLDRTISDVEMGPDGNLYYLQSSVRGGYIRSPLNKNDRIGRLLNPLADSTAQMTNEPSFFTAADGQAYAFFPDFTHTFKNPFDVSHYCQDSVQFHLNVGRGVDSVRWTFGEPTLGPQNHSSDLDPLVTYPEHGTFFVEVELWFDGRLLHTFADSILVLPKIEFNLPMDTLLCEGDSMLLDITQNFAVNYAWSTMDTTSSIWVSEAAWYMVTASNACGSKTDSIYIDVIPHPQAQFNDQTICEQDSFFTWELPYNEHYFYRWSTGDTTNAISLNEDGLYQVLWGSSCDSILEDFTLDIRPCACELYIPNAFSPNGDGHNDIFKIISACENLNYELLIYNRWGQILYRQISGEPQWNGTFQGQTAPSGIYLYKIIYQGTSLSGPVEGNEGGSVTLLK